MHFVRVLCLSVGQPVCLSVCLPVCLSICESVYQPTTWCNSLSKQQPRAAVPCPTCALQSMNCVNCAVSAAGFQLVDGKERMIVIEGLVEGAMQRIEGIALQALTGALPQPNATCRRAVHWHQGLR